jgi:hypothetical protein
MRSEIDGLAEETFFALEEEAATRGPIGWGYTQTRNLVFAQAYLRLALTGRDVETRIARAQDYLRQAVQYQPGLYSSASRALAAIRRRDLRGAIAIIRGMFPLVGGGAA